MTISGQTLMQQLNQLARLTESSDGITRTYLTPVHKAAGKQVIRWMQDAGMQTRVDNAGNVVGRYEGVTPDLPSLLIGSHFDTVRNAGKFDGTYGLIAAIACIQQLHQNNERLPFAIDVIGFSEEEGVRYNATLLGSRAIAGTFDHALLAIEDTSGIAMSTAMRDYGLDPDHLQDAAYNPAQVLGFIELHIEQGPVLLNSNLVAGVVTAIAARTRFNVRVIGLAGHAGTVPMKLRRDAAAAAAEILLIIEQLCIDGGDDLVGTVGQLTVPNGAANVIPAMAEFSIDIRGGNDEVRKSVTQKVQQHMDEIAARRNVNFELTRKHEASAARCAPWLMQQLENALTRHGVEPKRLLSGAGHDAMAMASLTDIAMLFVRCGNGGISHHPDETMTAEDAEVAASVLLTFIRQFKPA